MNEGTTQTDATNWNVDYDDIEPIRIRDPVAEALAVLNRGDPFVIDYTDLVTAAGHSCPTAAGAYRMAQLGLASIFPDTVPVRGDVEVTAGGPRDDPTYGVTSRLISYITGAAGVEGFAGLTGGYGERREHLHFDTFDADDPTFQFARTDTGETARVTYHVGDVPSAGPATRYLTQMIDGTATAEERAAFAEAWHGRVHSVLTGDELFSIRKREADA